MVCVLSSTLSHDSLYRNAVFISLQCSISVSFGRFFSLTVNLLRHIQLATKKQNFQSCNSKGRKAQEDCPDSPRPYTGGPRQSEFFRSLFVFFQEVRKRKERFCIYFFLNWGVNLSNKVLNIMMMNTTVSHKTLFPI